MAAGHSEVGQHPPLVPEAGVQRPVGVVADHGEVLVRPVVREPDRHDLAVGLLDHVKDLTGNATERRGHLAADPKRMIQIPGPNPPRQAQPHPVAHGPAQAGVQE